MRSRLLILVITLIAAGCQAAGSRSPVIATVNGQEVRRADFERFLKLKTGDFTHQETNDRLLSEMLDEYLIRRLVLAEARRAGLEVTDAEIDHAARENPQIKPTVAVANAREELVNDLLVEKYYRQVLLRDVRVEPEEIQSYIEDNQSRLTDRPGFYVREIRKQTRDEIERLRHEVTEGKRDFAAVARLHSDAPNAEQGGLARYEEGNLPDVLEKAITPLRPGDVSAIIQSNYGFHVFKLERRTQPYSPEERRSQLDGRRAQLAEELVARRNQQAVDTALARLKAEAVIKIVGSTLDFTYDGEFGHN